MITLLLQLLRLLPFLCGGHRQLVLENLALHQQLAVYKRTVPRPKLRTTDRLFWVALARVWSGWRQPLVIVTPDTILRGSGAVSVSTGPNSPVGPPEAARPSTTSTLPRIPALLGRPSRSWTPSPTIPPRPISSAIATPSPATPSANA